MGVIGFTGGVRASDAADHWDREAATFDDAPDHGLRDPRVRAAWRELLTPLLPPAPAAIADLGCGTGSLTLLLAEAGHALTGLDLAPAMVRIARSKAAAARQVADLVVGDAAMPPWADDSFDVVLCRHVLWAIDDPAATLDEWFRILRPGGHLLLIEGRWSTGAGMPATTVVELLAAGGRSATVTQLEDPALWGRAITDERYLVVSRTAR